VKVPEGFIWGAATAAHQVEGGNWNSDWWAWEHDPGSPCAEVSGDACDHYNLYPNDIQMLAMLGFNAYRFSVEWARIEPEDSEFSTAQLEHYLHMAATCHEHGLEAIVTFHHFTSPRWIAELGGWENPSVADRFARFCDRVAAHLGDAIDAACTINEPNMPSLHGYLTGIFPPGKRDSGARARAADTFIAAHRAAYDAIKQHAEVPVGMTLAMAEHIALEGGEEKMTKYRARNEDMFLEAAAGDDFIGVQTYSRAYVGPNGYVFGLEPTEDTLPGYDFDPRALEATIRRTQEVVPGTQILVTENGLATAKDENRIDYVATALQGMGRCLEDGIDVRGYCYWSLLDNFEWVLGYGPKFGLVAVDRETQERTIKDSARWLGDIARSGDLSKAQRSAALS